ncbi:ABC-2 type transporter [Lachnoclostridium sp. An169]|uniref:ABC transporter permease n=1 Tax=Lachnoclostridium sp. An169 TaxID=1965569 RepID=UPI000B390888|nr:ABC transporter permease [Lachnoclostridium sp. An169]OUP83828.1 ABC-2 type transporter [Lachnoclostridium sp. An169]
MLHLVKYAMKTKLRNFNNVVFWPLVFPLALATLLYLAVSGMDEADFETVPVAVVMAQASADPTAEAETDGNTGPESNNGADPFLLFLDSVETESDLIRTEEMFWEDALDALENGEVEGIFCTGAAPSLHVSGSGLPETILQSLLDSYMEGKQTLEDIAQTHPEGMEDALGAMENYRPVVRQVSLGGKTTDGTAQYFYALIGMGCLYGSFIGFQCAMSLQANLSPVAARRCVSCVHRLKMIAAEAAAAFGIHFVNMLILLIYLKYILRLEFTGSYIRMVPVVLAGSMIGVAMGLFVSSFGHMKESVKIGILIAVSMAASFLAGLMNPDIKNAAEQHFPALRLINPASLISDALYCINVYDAPRRLMTDLIILFVMCGVMIFGAFLMVRRERYDSI